MSSNLDQMLNETMQKSLDSFLSSLQSGGPALTSFLGTWSTFNNTIRMHHNKLQEETLVAVHNFASMINAITSNVLELEMSSERLLNDSVMDVSKILEEEMGGLTIHDEHRSKPSKGASTYPAYIKPAYEWLLLNLHNPYPSKEVKKNFSRQTKCSVKDIDSWFIDARKRIGWNKLRKTRFSNKQEKIIAAAVHFFNQSPRPFTDDLTVNLESEADLSDQYNAEFTAMQDAAKSLYSGRFAASFTTPFDGPASRSAPTTATSGTSAGREQVRSPDPTESSNGRKRARSPEPINHDLIFSYPTPEPSPGQFAESSPSPSTPLSLPELPLLQSRKRRQSSIEAPERDVQDSLARPQKRSRLETHEFPDLVAVASLPSPANTIDLTEDGPEDSPLPTEPTAPAPPAVPEALPTKRKRRLSDGDSSRPTKRPHHAFAVPRLQTVSDPFPITKPAADDSFDEWFQGQFPAEHQLSDVIPSPTNLKIPVPLDDPNVPLDVDCYQYDFSPYQAEIHLPETPLLSSASITAGPSYSASETSNPVETLEMTSDYEALALTNPLPDVDFAGIIGAGDFTLDLNFDSLPNYQELNPPTSFDPLDQTLNFDCFDDSTPSNISWTSYLSSPPDDIFDLGQPLPSYNAKTPVLGNFNSTLRQDVSSSDEQDAKRLRAQQLREELRRLEAEITV